MINGKTVALVMPCRNESGHLSQFINSMVVPEKLRTLDRGRPWRDSQFASTRLSPSRDMSR